MSGSVEKATTRRCTRTRFVPEEQTLITFYEYGGGVVDVTKNPYYLKTKRLQQLHDAIVNVEKEIAALNATLRILRDEGREEEGDGDESTTIVEIIKEKIPIRERLVTAHRELARELRKAYEG